MNPSINSLLGPLEAAARQGSWEDVEDIAREIARLSRFQRHSELLKIQEAIFYARDQWALKAQGKPVDFMDDPKTPPGGSQGAKTPSYAKPSEGRPPPEAPFMGTRD